MDLVHQLPCAYAILSAVLFLLALYSVLSVDNNSTQHASHKFDAKVEERWPLCGGPSRWNLKGKK